jgi:chitinase
MDGGIKDPLISAGIFKRGVCVRLHRLWILVGVWLFCACHELPENRAPVARPGPSRTVQSGGLVTLDGSASSDPEGNPLTFSWSFVSVPSGSTVKLSDPSSVQPTFTPEQGGDYVIQLVVNDGTNSSSPETLTLTAENPPPIANAGNDMAASVGFTITLRGQVSTRNAGPFTFSWALTQKPASSTTSLNGADTATPTLTLDAEGTYTLSLVVTDSRATSSADTLTLRAITVQRPSFREFGHGVLDAEYSTALDRVVMVATNPDALYVYDVETQTEHTVPLPHAPTSVSVGPDGRFAAVGHDSFISYVDLTIPSLLKSVPVRAKAFDIVLAGNGYVHVFPNKDQWVSIHSVNLATDQETLSRGLPIYEGARARLQPGGRAIYGSTTRLSPGDIEKYNIVEGTAEVLYDSPYHGTYPICDNLWFSEDGRRIFTACGNTFRTSSVKAEDMVYAGKLALSADPIRSLSHSLGANRVALVQYHHPYTDPSVATHVSLFMPDSLAFDRSVPLPAFIHEEQSFTGYGRFVFYSAAGDRLIVLLQANSDPESQSSYGVVIL